MPPKTNTQKLVQPVEIEDATLDFVFIGPHEGEQKLLARSKNLDLLLLGLARLPPHYFVEQEYASSPNGIRVMRVEKKMAAISPKPKAIKGLFENDPEATLYSITAMIPPIEAPDSRAEPYTFAWIGRSLGGDLTLIHEYFQNCAIPLAQATGYADAREQVQWQIAPLLFLCARLTKARRKTEVTLRRDNVVSAVLDHVSNNTSLEFEMRYYRRLMIWMPLLATMLTSTIFGIVYLLISKSIHP
jgi:hypothetical protein